MRAFVIGAIIGTMISFSVIAQETDPPYIYYHSSQHDGLIIESANGTDSRLLPEVPPGRVEWSSSGRWLVIRDRWLQRTDGTLRVDLPFRNTYASFTRWSPNTDLLLVVREDIAEETIRAYLFDPEHGQIQAMGTLSFEYEIYSFEGWASWSVDGTQATVQWSGATLTLYIDGRSETRPAETADPPFQSQRSDFLEGSVNIPLSLVPPGLDAGYGMAFPSPDGNLLALLSTPPTVIDCTGTVVRQVIPHSYSVFPERYPVSFQWSDDSQWGFVNYSIVNAGGGGYLPSPVIFDIAGTVRRELPMAGFGVEAGFVPERALSHLSAGQPTSIKRDPRFTLPQAGVVAAVEWHPVDPDQLVTYSSDEGIVFWSLDNDVPERLRQMPAEAPELRYQSAYKLTWLNDETVELSWEDSGSSDFDTQGMVTAASGRFQCCVTLFNQATGEQLTEFYGTGYTLALSPDGQRLATTSIGATQIWDISDVSVE